MTPGSPPNHRPRLVALALLLAFAIAAAACSSGGGTSASSVSSSTPPPPQLVLSIAPAAFHLTAPVQREVAAVSGGTVYLAGGLDSANRSAAGVFSLDPATGKLTYIGNVPAAFHDGAGVVIGGRLFVFGGGSGQSTDTVQSFDLATHRGAVAGHLPTALSDLASASANGTVYLVGGYDGNAPQPTVYATSDGSRFREAGRLPVGLRYAAVVAVGTDLIVAGGIAASGPVSTVYRFDTTTGKTTLVGNLPSPVGHAAAFAIGGKVYVAGGLDASGAAVTDVTEIDPAAKTLTPADPLRKPVADAAVASTSDGVWLIGGWRGAAVDQVLHARLETVLATPSDTVATPSASAATSPSTDPALVRPFAGLLLVADRGNNRLLVLNPKGRIVWRYPDPAAPPPPVPFYFPDDAFWVHGGHAILVNEEDNDVMAEIAYPSGRTLWTYGHPRAPGSSPGYLHQPDDAFPYPGGGVVVADAMNCRILFLDGSGNPKRQMGTTGTCTHGLPDTVGYPNGDTPLPNGHLLLSELNGGYVDEVKGDGHVVWALHVPGAPVPSDPWPLPDGSFMVADYQHPGGVVRFTGAGRVLWSYHPTTGPGVLDHPSLAVPLPNGLVAVNDDYRHRIVFIDPKTNKIVWQYGTTDQPGSGLGQLHYPDGMDLLLPDGSIPLHVDFPSPAVHAGRP